MEREDPPDFVDPALEFGCIKGEGGRDYLIENTWQTFPGRMAAWCQSGQFEYRVSKSELPDELSPAIGYWVRGFLVGNVPRQPEVEDEDPEMARWWSDSKDFLVTGSWPPRPAS